MVMGREHLYVLSCISYRSVRVMANRTLLNNLENEKINSHVLQTSYVPLIVSHNGTNTGFP